MTKESKNKFIHESFKIDQKRILNFDEKLKEETVKRFLDKFSGLVAIRNIMFQNS